MGDRGSPFDLATGASTVGENYVLYLERLDATRVGLGAPDDLWGTRLDVAVLADLLVRTGRTEG